MHQITVKILSLQIYERRKSSFIFVTVCTHPDAFKPISTDDMRNMIGSPCKPYTPNTSNFGV